LKKLLFILSLLITLSSCGSKKRVVTKRTTTANRPAKIATVTAAKIIDYAQQFEGVRYKYGGTTKKGMDCSGLIYKSFTENNIAIPRISSDMAKTGDWIDIKVVEPGDLVFFATKKNSRRVNHVGLVTKVRGDDFEFIHSTTSRGVITSSIKERYWYLAYVQARRLL